MFLFGFLSICISPPPYPPRLGTERDVLKAFERAAVS